jgi:hypothetical protein
MRHVLPLWKLDKGVSLCEDRRCERLVTDGFSANADNAARMPESGYNYSRKGPAM